MNRVALSLICYLAFSLHVLSVSGIARGVTLCTHSDGQSRVESADELAACHAKQQAGGVAAFDRTCVDSPFTSNQITQPVANSRAVLLEASQVQIALPTFFRELTSSLFLKPSVARLTELSRMVPDGERASLKTVVLVI